MKKENPSQADRFNMGKLQFSFLFDAPNALKGETLVWMFGAEKYNRRNWLKGLPYTSVIDSMLRHLAAFQSGEDIDTDSGLPHVDHIQCNARMLSEFYHTRPDYDDRAKTDP